MQTELDQASRPITTFYTQRWLRQSRRFSQFLESIHLTLADIPIVRNIYVDIWKTTQLWTNQSPAASLRVWSYPIYSGLHPWHYQNWIVWGYLLSTRYCTHPRPKNCLTYYHKTNHHSRSQTISRYGKLQCILHTKILQ